MTGSQATNDVSAHALSRKPELSRMGRDVRAGSASPNQVLGIVSAGIILANLDLFIVNVALADIARNSPRASLEDLSRILNGDAITYAALLVFFGRLAERHQRNYSFMLGIGPGHDVARPSPTAAALVTGGVALVTYAIIRVPDWGRYSAKFGACRAVSAVCLFLFVLHCARSKTPFIYLGLFRSRLFTGSVLVTMPFSAAFGGMLLSIALYEQTIWRFSALRTGLTIVPGSLMVSLTSPLIFGHLIKRFGYAQVISGGILCYAVGVLYWAMTLTTVPTITPVVIGMLLTGIGLGLTIPTLMGVGSGSLPPSSFATGSGVINMSRQAFMAIGVAVLIDIVGAPASPAERRDACHLGWYVLAAIALIGLVPTILQLRTNDVRRGLPETPLSVTVN